MIDQTTRRRVRCLGCNKFITKGNERFDADNDPLCPPCYDADFIERRNAERREAKKHAHAQTLRHHG